MEVVSPWPKVSRWRNGLAHWTSNSKVAGSSPARDVLSFSAFFPFLLHVLLLESRVDMWTRLLSGWRVCRPVQLATSYRCKKLYASKTITAVHSETKVLLFNKYYLNDENYGSMKNKGHEGGFTSHLGDQVLGLNYSLYHDSLHERLESLIWTLNFKPASMKLPAQYEHSEEESTPSSDSGYKELEGKWCSSVLKKRRSKMNKHKHRKRRKKYKFLRRALGR